MKNKLKIFTLFLALFIIISLFVYQNNFLSQQEIKIINAVQSYLKNIPLDIAKFITYFGHERNWQIMVVIAITTLLLNKKFKELILYILAFPCVDFCFSFAKDIILRPRPPVNLHLITVGNTSYPSGHSSISMVTYGLLIYFVCKYVRNKILRITLVSLLSTLILLVGFSRVWIGVHFPTDVLGGYCLGICIVTIFAIINEIKITSKK